MTFVLTDKPLEALLPLSPPPSCGAVVVFHGHVRNQHEGRQVVDLTYTAYPELALREGERILAEAAKTFPIDAVQAVHRTGRLDLGEEAIRVEVATPHRLEGFQACQWIMDEIKRRVPIWKHETYEGGAQAWVHCHPHASEACNS